MGKRTHKDQPTYGYNHLEPGHPNNTKTWRVCGAKTRNPASKHRWCQNAAGYGTAHPGAGRCKLHGGGKVTRNRYSSLMHGRLKEIARRTVEQDTSDPLDLMSELEVQRVLLGLMIDEMQLAAPRLLRSFAPEPLPDGFDNDNYQHPAESADLGSDRDPGPAAASAPPLSDTAERSEASGMPISKPSRTQAALLEYIEKNTAHNNKHRAALASPETDTVVSGGTAQISSSVTQCTTHSQDFSNSKIENNKVVDRSEDNIKAFIGLYERIRLQLLDIVSTVTKITAQRNSTAITLSEVAWVVLTLKEGMERFVPKENREAYVQWIKERLPGHKAAIVSGKE